MNKRQKTFFAATVAAVFDVGCESKNRSGESGAQLNVTALDGSTSTTTSTTAHGDGGTHVDMGAGFISPTEYDGGSGMLSHWRDTDGVDPDTAGCHFEWNNMTCMGNPILGREFGEACLDEDRLLETNPDPPNECHPHAGDIGHPYIYSCQGWCMGSYGFPGACEGGVAVTSTYGNCTSARCVCDDCPVECDETLHEGSDCDPDTGTNMDMGGICAPSALYGTLCCFLYHERPHVGGE